jgi:hypothetical protein
MRLDMRALEDKLADANGQIAPLKFSMSKLQESNEM